MYVHSSLLTSQKRQHMQFGNEGNYTYKTIKKLHLFTQNKECRIYKDVYQNRQNRLFRFTDFTDYNIRPGKSLTITSRILREHKRGSTTRDKADKPRATSKRGTRCCSLRGTP